MSQQHIEKGTNMLNRTTASVCLVGAALAASAWGLGAAPNTSGAVTIAQDAAPSASAEATGVAIVWTSADPEVAHRMVLMYAEAAKKNGWFGEVRLVVWGPSQKLVVGDKNIRAALARLAEAGVVVEACLACADQFGIADDLREAGLEVRYMGQPLTQWLKADDWEVMTY
jgi:hypothetical protein